MSERPPCPRQRHPRDRTRGLLSLTKIEEASIITARFKADSLGRRSMSSVATKTGITPEVLLDMPDAKDFDLIDGELVERKMGALSSWIGGEVLFLLRLFLRDNPLGLLFGADNGYNCFPDKPNKLRR